MVDTAKLRTIPESHRMAALERLTRHLVEHGAESADARASVEIVSRIVDVLEVNQRRDLAERFAHAPKAPAKLVRRFACDNIVVADPVLRWSNLINVSFLNDILGEVGDSHLQVVSQRSALTGDMADILITHGSAAVHARIAHNAHVQLTNDILDKLMASASRQPCVEEALCAREDLPEKASQVLMQRVSRRLREEVGSVAETLSPTALRLALRTRDTDNSAKDSDIQGLSFEALTTITRLARSGRLSGDHLTDFARQGDMGAVIACFASLARIQSTVARRLILQPSNEGLAVAARAAKLEQSAFAAIVDLKNAMNMSDGSQPALSEEYDEVPVETAKQIMTFHAACRVKGGRRSEADSVSEMPWTVGPVASV